MKRRGTCFRRPPGSPLSVVVQVALWSGPRDPRTGTGPFPPVRKERFARGRLQVATSSRGGLDHVGPMESRGKHRMGPGQTGSPRSHPEATSQRSPAPPGCLLTSPRPCPPSRPGSGHAPGQSASQHRSPAQGAGPARAFRCLWSGGRSPVRRSEDSSPFWRRGQPGSRSSAPRPFRQTRLRCGTNRPRAVPAESGSRV